MEAAGRNNVLVQALLSRGINVAVTRKHGESSSKGGGGMGGGGGGGGGGFGFGFDGAVGGGGFGGYGPGFSRSAGGQGPTAVSGNFIHAKRRGVVNGVDFLYTGDVVRQGGYFTRARTHTRARTRAHTRAQAHAMDYVMKRRILSELHLTGELP